MLSALSASGAFKALTPAASSSALQVVRRFAAAAEPAPAVETAQGTVTQASMRTRATPRAATLAWRRL